MYLKNRINILICVLISFVFAVAMDDINGYVYADGWSAQADVIYNGLGIMLNGALCLFCLSCINIKEKISKSFPFILLASCAFLDSVFCGAYAIAGPKLFDTLEFIVFNAKYNWNLLYTTIEVALLSWSVASGLLTFIYNALRDHVMLISVNKSIH